MALALTGRLNTSSAGAFGTPAFTTSAFTPSNSSLLYVVVGLQLNNVSFAAGRPTITDSLTSTWTFRQEGSITTGDNFALHQAVFTTPITTGTSMTVTVDDDDNDAVNVWTVMAVDVTGYDTGTPIGGTATNGTTDIADGAETQTLSAAPTTNDITIVTLYEDCENAPNPTYGAGSWTSVYNTEDGSGATGRSLGYRTASTSTSVPITDVYTGAGGFFKGSMISCVVNAAAGAAFIAPPAVNINQTVPRARYF